MESRGKAKVQPGVNARCLITIYAVAMTLVAGCGGSGSSGSVGPPRTPPVTADYLEVSASNLPTAVLGGRCMDADQGDVDGDGDTDLVLAQEIGTNIVLINDGAGVFAELANAVGGGFGDNEDVRLADFDNDGDLDMLTVHEDDGEHSLLLNDGSGVFIESVGAIPVNSVANAAEVVDLDLNLLDDILLGNEGPNIVLLQLANVAFFNDTGNRPIGAATTQDLLLVDVDNDGDEDLLSVNESDDRLFINNGNGVFADESATRWPGNDGETREADAADVDGDGDLDIVLGNVSFNLAVSPANRLMLNDGTGNFSDATSTNLGGVLNQGDSFTIRFFDIDADGDPDILSPRNTIGAGGSLDVWINDGTGSYTPAPASPFSTAPNGSIFDIEVIDVDSDGRNDLYLCHRTGTDQLYIRN